VDIEPSSTNAFDVYWITDGEWLEYTFEATTSGTYAITPYVAGVPGFGALRMLIDNEDVSGRVDVPATGGWQTWEPLTLPDVPIEAGEHILRFEFESASDPTGWLFSLNYIDVALRTVDAGAEAEQAARFTVRPNAPNPFSETTRITYVLPESGRVSFEVFNAIGQKVYEGVEENQSAGEHVFEFDARGLPSGMYVCRVRTGAAVATLPMMVVR
jgi:hypothetical protein